MSERYQIGDIVTFNGSPSLGLWEITGQYDKSAYQYSITNNGCDTEKYAKHRDLILVCSVNDRKDIDLDKLGVN